VGLKTVAVRPLNCGRLATPKLAIIVLSAVHTAITDKLTPKDTKPPPTLQIAKSKHNQKGANREQIGSKK